MNFQTILTFINILVMGAAGVGFIYTKTDEAKFNPAPVIERVAALEGEAKVLKSETRTMKEDIKEIKGDVKELLKAFRPADYRPALKDTNIPLIKGVTKDGSPENEHD